MVRIPTYRRFAPLPSKCPHCGKKRPFKASASHVPQRPCPTCGNPIQIRTPRAFVEIDRKKIWLGAYDSDEALRAYERLVAVRKAAHISPEPTSSRRLTVNELLEKYVLYARKYYADRTAEPDENGERPLRGRFAQIRPAVRYLSSGFELPDGEVFVGFGHLRVTDFGPKQLKELQEKLTQKEIESTYKRPSPELVAKVHALIGEGKSRAYVGRKLKLSPWRVRSIASGKYDAAPQPETLSLDYINSLIQAVQAVFEWGVANDLVDVAIHQRLETVQGLRSGFSDARETSSRKSVNPDHVEAVLPHLAPPLVAMVKLQRLTGMRPDELCKLRMMDIDMADDVWLYWPPGHKTNNKGKLRAIPFGPQSQLILRPFLSTDLTKYLFSPRDAAAWRSEQQRKQRQTKVQPSQRNRRKKRPERAPGAKYTPASYRVAIQRACVKADVPKWFPYQLRHLYATEVRREFGEEAASVSLGHAQLSTTKLYGERNIAKAVSVAKEIG